MTVMELQDVHTLQFVFILDCFVFFASCLAQLLSWLVTSRRRI